MELSHFQLNRFAVLSIVLLVLALTVAPFAGAVTYTITVKTDASSYTGAQTLTASGVVSPAPGPGTAVFLSIRNPSGDPVAVASAPVDGASGSYQHSFVLGGSSKWVTGTYTVNASWGYSVSSPTISASAKFTYSPTGNATTSTTTTSSTSTTTSTTSSTSSSSTASSTTTSTTSTSTTTSQTSTTTPSTTSSTTSTASIPTQTTTSSSSSSTTTSTGGGGIPEFPLQLLAVAVFTFLLVTSYLFARHRWTPSGMAGRSSVNALNRGIRRLG